MAVARDKAYREAYEDEQSEEWLGIVHLNRDRWTEFYLRGIKDLLADTSEIGPLREIIDKRKTKLLGFYIALMDGIRKELFPEVITAFRDVSEHADWSQVEEARQKGYRRAKGLMREIITLAARGDHGMIRNYLESKKKTGWEVIH